MSVAEVIAILMLLLSAGGVWLLTTAIRTQSGSRLIRVIGALALIAGPLLALHLTIAHYSAVTLAIRALAVTLVGVALIGIAWRSPMTRLRAMGMVLLGSALLAIGLWFLAGDFLIRRQQLTGYVADKRYEKRNPDCTRCAMDYVIYLSGRRYAATVKVFEQVHPGDRIRAKFGRASRRILSFEVQ